MELSIRYMTEKDLPAILQMALQEGWKSDLIEFRMFIEFNPLGCFVCTNARQVIGAITTFCHNKSAWIGNFIVAEKYRGQGIGKKLFLRAIEYLDKKKKKQIYLNAAYKAKGLYAKFGFADVISVNRWQGKAVKSMQDVCRLQKSIPDILSFIKLDSFLWKDERFSLISQLSFLRHVRSSIRSQGILMYGYIGNITTIGPWEFRGDNKNAAEELFVSAFSNIQAKSKIALDVPAVNKEAERILAKYNFRIVGSTIFMCRGKLPKIHFNEIFSFATMGSMG
ncbi:MAG: GNAT family N-acetyltransferase [Candidatus Aureabacteria bacterium]|nr:GNAT family N-acetyltransferase [Candidatus Auribacterota bacterium]